ncbi:heme exporter subunit; membrane component of ABC superfamily [Magnetospirillum gryphiswaldense MSR-1 v2]|uniref:Heme exporter protein C n=1 Tax=Magnetospirillum gryphiswaldense (strain DSM 6361 / JCM 21280 / NBRC 15271 / MSR-1) TaxID=431944 RepID=A4GL47_MAGGM|nr:heme ABC transporter permease [Magnetospirillum gryphiswaldense]ABO28734.1 CcmC [Magnetospirillum gryphiswaldense MSR-1]CDL00401.1 heme exporter subunit; membrane component of ABC superfamily [Magnetospirillum gryphiswaldense MSR-1 v2]
MHRFANPARFLRIAAFVQPWAMGIAVLSFAAGLWFSLLASPADYQQGETVRIMYIHVPSAWMGMFCYTAMAVFSAMGLIWKHPLADLMARATAPVGAAFTLICLVTGSLWGKPMWGTWWVWDARLTSMLILFFLYLGYMALADAFDDPERGQKAANILALVGVFNVPIIKWSVDWWNTLHQPASVVKMGGPAIDASMMVPLILMALAFKAYWVVVLILRTRAEIAAAKLRTLRMAQVHAAGQTEVELHG